MRELLSLCSAFCRIIHEKLTISQGHPSQNSRMEYASYGKLQMKDISAGKGGGSVMSGLRTSNFRRIHVGLLLDLVLMFLLPAIIAALLGVVLKQLEPAGVGTEGVTVSQLLANSSPAVWAMYAFLTLQYCLAALCALLVVSGLGELESESGELRRANRWFMLLMAADGVVMLAHISDRLLSGDNAITPASTIYFAAVLLLFTFRFLALRALMRGYGKLLERVGASEQALRALSLSRRIVAAIGLLMLVFISAFSLTLFDLVEPGKNAVRFGAVAAFGFYVFCRIQIVRFARDATGLIAAISE